MTKYFTHYWLNSTWEQDRNEGVERFDYTAGKLFEIRGVRSGDVVYAVTVYSGKLFVCGSVTVGEICDRNQASKIIQTPPQQLWKDATEFIIPSHSTTVNFDIQVPDEITRRLTFITKEGEKSLVFKSKNHLDQQTLRGVRQLTEESAALLDSVLYENGVSDSNFAPIEELENDYDEFVFESFAEGSKTQKYVTTYERSPRLKRIALRIHGYDCKGCGFNFKKIYGERGKEFIHVHHIKPISEFDGEQIVNPETDMTVLCPNCHAMVHRRKNTTLSIEQLKEIIESQKKLQ